MKRVFLLIIALFTAVGAYAQVENSTSWSSSFKKVSKSEYKLTLEANIESGAYIYGLDEYVNGPTGTSIKFEIDGDVEIDGEVIPSKKATIYYDDVFRMDIGKFVGSVKFTQKFKVTSENYSKITATVEWMSCTDESCTPPIDMIFTFEINEHNRPASGASVVTGEAVEEAENSAQIGALVAGKDNARSLWSIIIEAILWGFAALLTPCVFPMVPMTVSFFMKGNKSKTKGRAMASLYGICIVALYTIPIAVIILLTFFLGGDAVTADIFNWLSTHWIPNVIFFLVFMFFAASFLGAFEIVMPSWLVNKSDSKADKGGFLGVFFMALTLVLVSFSCTGPIVGSILVQSTQGEIWEPIIAMFVFSVAFALPFTLFAFFPSLLKNLPKSGGWLNSVKVVLGFIELALGLKFLSVADQTYRWGLLDREVYLALWIVIFTLLGFYLLGKIKFSHDSDTPYVKVKSLFLAIVTFSFVVYLIPGMWGAPLRALSGYLPPTHTIDFNLSKLTTSEISTVDINRPTPKYSANLHLPEGLKYGFFDYNEGVEYAKKVDKPIFLDFTGHGCVNCREMEANVLSDPRILKILNSEYVIISLYVDDRLNLPESEWVTTPEGRVLKTLGRVNAALQIDKFGVNAQPYYVLMNSKEQQLTKPFAYDKNIDKFIEFLNRGIEEFKEKK